MVGGDKGGRPRGGGGGGERCRAFSHDLWYGVAGVILIWL